MANNIRIKRRISGLAGAPSTLKNAELAYNEVDNTLYYGKGDIGDGTASTIIQIGGTGVFATIADLVAYAKKDDDNTFIVGKTNTFNGTVNLAGVFQIAGAAVTATAAELNVLDGISATTAELNILHNLTATTAELNILDGVTADSTELNYLADVVLGTGAAGKAVVLGLDSSIDLAGTDIECRDITTSGDIIVGGDLTVQGTLTSINSVTVTVTDKNLELASTESPTDSTADGGGITVKASINGATDKKLYWALLTSAWTSNQDFDLTIGHAYHIDGEEVLSKTALGTSVVSSSLTSVGTITSGIWESTTPVGLAYGGTGATTASGARTALELGSMATQNKDNVDITGGSIVGVVLDGGTF